MSGALSLSKRARQRSSYSQQSRRNTASWVVLFRRNLLAACDFSYGYLSKSSRPASARRIGQSANVVVETGSVKTRTNASGRISSMLGYLFRIDQVRGRQSPPMTVLRRRAIVASFSVHGFADLPRRVCIPDACRLRPCIHRSSRSGQDSVS